jgi:hypothetical protein
MKADRRRIPKARRIVMNVEEGTGQFTLAQADTARSALISGSVRRSTAQQYASRMRVLKAWHRARQLREISRDSFILFLADARHQGLADLGCFRAALLHEQHKTGVEPWANEQALVLATRRDQEMPLQEKGVITVENFDMSQQDPQTRQAENFDMIIPPLTAILLQQHVSLDSVMRIKCVGICCMVQLWRLLSGSQNRGGVYSC